MNNLKTLCLTGLFVCSGQVFANQKIEVQGHRGARGSRPENTLPAFEFAIAQGVDTLELDIAVSLDGELVISHEPAITPDRCLDPEGHRLKELIYIHTLKYEDIKKYDCGSLGNERFPGQVNVPHTPLPRLSDLFEMVANSKLPAAKTVHFNIETKIYPAKPELTPAPAEFAKKFSPSCARDISSRELFCNRLMIEHSSPQKSWNRA